MSERQPPASPRRRPRPWQLAILLLVLVCVVLLAIYLVDFFTVTNQALSRANGEPGLLPPSPTR